MNASIEEIYRQEYGRILATLIRILGDFIVAEDALQEAFTQAVTAWRVDLPHNPRAWIIRTAQNKAIDWYRKKQRGDARKRLVISDDSVVVQGLRL